MSYAAGRLVTNVSGFDEVLRLSKDRGVDVDTFRTSFGRAKRTLARDDSSSGTQNAGGEKK